MLRAVSCLCALTVGCIDRAPIADDDPIDRGVADAAISDGALGDRGRPDAGSAADAWTVFDPGAPITTPPSALLFEPDAEAEPRSIMQGGDHQLIWAGDRYVLLWMQNIGGRVQVVGRTVRDGRASPLTALTTRDDPDQPASKDRAYGLWQADRLVVLWTADAGLWVQAFGRDLRPLSPVVEVFAPSAGDFLSILAVAPAGGDLGVAFGRSSDDYHPRLIRLASDGSPVLLDGFVFERMGAARPPVLVDLVADGDRFDSLWSIRRPAAVDSVFRAGLERSGLATSATGTLYQSENNIPQRYGVGAGVPFMVIDDLDAGLLFFQLDEQERPMPVRVADSGGAAVVHAPDAGRIAVVRETGVAQGGLPSGLTYQAFDYLEAVLGDAHPLVEFAGCLEAFDLAYTGEKLGVSYALGCSTRRLYLREIAVR